MRIGIDFDNTIADYRNAFTPLAQELGLVAPAFTGGKAALRDHLRARPCGEMEWQRLQGQVYGKHIGRAVVMPGFESFLEASRHHGAEVFIVSHKTEFGHLDDARINLRDAARNWLASHDFYKPAQNGIDPDNVTFWQTRDAKISAIRSLVLDHFIDDLEEIFEDTEFPKQTRAHLLRPSQDNGCNSSNWHDIRINIFGR